MTVVPVASCETARALAEAVMDKAGAIPGLIHAIFPAFMDGKLGDTEQFLRYCKADPKGETLWEVYEQSGFSDPQDFIVAHANAN